MSVEELISLQESMQEFGLEISYTGHGHILTDGSVLKCVIVFERGVTGFDLCLYMENGQFFKVVSHSGRDLEELYWPEDGALCNGLVFEEDSKRVSRTINSSTKFHPLNGESFEIISRMLN